MIWRTRLLSCRRKSFLSPHQSSTYLTLARGNAHDEAQSVVCFAPSQQPIINEDDFICVNIPRLYNYEPLTPLRILRASLFGRLVCVRGTVVRVGNIRPLCTRMAFRCLSCSHTQSLPLQHGKYATPTKVCTHTVQAHFFPALL